MVIMSRGRLIYEPPRFMSPHTAFKQILLTESERHSMSSSSINNSEAKNTNSKQDMHVQTLLPPDETLAISLSRIGTPTQKIISGTLTELAALPEEDFGEPLHSVVIVGKRLHPLELEYAGRWCVGGQTGDWWKIGKGPYGVVREGGH